MTQSVSGWASHCQKGQKKTHAQTPCCQETAPERGEEILCKHVADGESFPERAEAPKAGAGNQAELNKHLLDSCDIMLLLAVVSWQQPAPDDGFQVKGEAWDSNRASVHSWSNPPIIWTCEDLTSIICADFDRFSVMVIPRNLKTFTCSTSTPWMKTGGFLCLLVFQNKQSAHWFCWLEQ